MAIHFLLAFPRPVHSLCPKLFMPACWRRQWPVESVHWMWICAFTFNSGLAPSLLGSGLRLCHFKMRRRSRILFLSCRDTSDGYVRFSRGQLSCLKRKTDPSNGCHSLVMNANYTHVWFLPRILSLYPIPVQEITSEIMWVKNDTVICIT